MIVINTVNNERFSLNGIEYLKNFLSFVYGDKVGIYNAYDKTDQRVSLDTFVNFTVNGVVYESAALLQSALLEVIYTRDSLGAINTVLLGSVTPTSTPTGTGVAFWVATQAGTYTNFGGVVVAANSFAVISRNAGGAFSISQTTFDITSKVNVSDVINTLASTETAKPLSANQGKVLKDLVDTKVNTTVTDNLTSTSATNALSANQGRVLDLKISQGIVNWTAKAFLINDEVSHLGKLWQANAAIISTDVPGTSSKWVEVLSGYLENSDINKGNFDITDNDKTASQKAIYDKNKPYFDNIRISEQTDGFYLSDNDGNIIAKVTSAGVQSVAFLNKAGVSLSGISDYINVNLMPDGFHFTDYNGYTVAKITKDGIQSTNYLDKDGNTLKSTSLTTLIKGLEFYSLGDSLSAANLWQPKLAELTNSTFNATVNTNTPLSVGGTRTGGVNTTCGQWRAKLLFELNVKPKVIFIENINDVNIISYLGTIDDEPFMLQNIITYPTTFASLTALNTWLADGSFATYLGTFATLDRKIGSGIRFPYTDGTTQYREYIFDSKVVANWTNATFWKYESTGATIYKVYKGLLQYLKAKFPTALIMWFAPTRIAIQTVSGQTGYNATFWNADGSFNMTTYKAHVDSVNYKTLVDAQKKVCEYYAVPFINVNEECGINPLNFLNYYPQNDVHPLPLGYEKWGETIAKLI